MNNLKSLSVKRKIIISLSLVWAVLSFIVAIYIIVEDGSSDVLENFLTFLISFLIFTAPVWIYWTVFWIWGESAEKLTNDILVSLSIKLTGLGKKIISIVKRNLYKTILLLSIIVVSLISGTIVKSAFRSFSENKEIVEVLSNLGATENEIKDLTVIIKSIKALKANQPKTNYAFAIDETAKNYTVEIKSAIGVKDMKHSESAGEYTAAIIEMFEKENEEFFRNKDNTNLLDAKSFRSIMLRYAASEINKKIPIKIDELTYLIEFRTDGDRMISYKTRVDFAYSDAKKIFDYRKDAMYQGRKKYLCQDKQSAKLRRVRAIVVYEYFSKDMSPIGSLSIDIGKEC